MIGMTVREAQVYVDASEKDELLRQAYELFTGKLWSSGTPEEKVRVLLHQFEVTRAAHALTEGLRSARIKGMQDRVAELERRKEALTEENARLHAALEDLEPVVAPVRFAPRDVARAQISRQEVEIFKVLLEADDWLSHAEMYELVYPVSPRQVRATTLKFTRLGLVERADVFPGIRVRLVEDAEQRNPSYYRRLVDAADALGIFLGGEI